MNRGNVFLGGAVAFTAIALFVLRPGAPSVNERIPAFSVGTPEGGTLTAAALEGKVALVNVWASWCAPCREELPALNSLAARYDTSRVVFVALSDDVNSIAAREFLMLGSLPNMRVGLGLGELRNVFHYPGLPFTVLADRNGRIVRTWFGYGGPPQLAAIDSIIRTLVPR